MTLLRTCPNGHQWEPPAAGLAAVPADPVLCPVCGATAAAGDQKPAEDIPAAEAPTLLPPPAPAGVTASGPAQLVLTGEDRPTLAGYEVLGVLGKGGMGIVYKARHTKLDRTVAIKVLPPGAGTDPAFAERFTREARALARLNHPNILAVYDFGQAGEEPYFVMEYVEGTDLRQRLRAGRLPPHEALQIAARICEALQYAHEEGIVHRDVKPENVLIDKRGRVKIADFGIAKLLTGRTAQYTLTGPWQIVGTIRYMAPEQMDNPLGLDHRADVYSLGVVLYEMLTGELPMGRFPPPSQRAAVDSRTDEVVLRALERDPERRYQQAGEMKAALERLEGEVPRGEAVPAVIRTEGQAVSAPSQETAPWDAEGSTKAVPEAIRRRLKMAAYALLSVGLIGLALTFVGTAAVVVTEIESYPRRKFFITGTVWAIIGLCYALLLSSWVLWSALGILNLASYRRAVSGCLVAILPLTPLWPLSVLVGLWVHWVLSEPEVQAAFAAEEIRRRRADGNTAAWLWRMLASTTTWAILLVLVGLGFLIPIFGQELGFWGLVVLAVLLALLGFLISTDFIDPLPIWRSAVVASGGLGIVLFVALAPAQGDWCIVRFSRGAAERPLLGVGVGLLVVGTVELRRALLRRHNPKG
jgi:predicted Ser/Thr protein kinase